MDIFSLKTKEIVDPASGNQKGNTALSTLANLSSAFKEMINKSGGAGDSAGAFDALSRQFAGAERVEPKAHTDENPYERDELGQSNRDDHTDTSDDHSDSSSDNRAEPADNYESNSNQSRGEEHNDAAGDNRSDTGADNASDRSAGRDEQSSDSGRENASDTGKEASTDGQAHADSGNQNQQQGPAASGDTTNQSGNVSANSAQNQQQGPAASGDTTNQSGNVSANNAQNQQQGPAASGDTTNQSGNVSANSAQMNLAGVMAMAQSGGAQTNTNENAAVNAGASAQRDNAIQGLATATANTGKDAAANKGNNQTNANTNANANAQAKVSTGGENQSQGERSVTDGRAAQQAADMANKIGNGPKIAVTVNVADEAETIVSKPTATLTAASLKATENDATNQTGQQASGRANQGVNPAALAHAAPQAQNGLNTAQTQQGNAQQGQTQAATSSGGDAKGMVQGPLNATAQTATSTTTESATPTTTASTNETQQSKENQTAKEAQAQRFTPQRQAIADQVTVQINKAIAAGQDRINIQLRPESLGRVDVKMDIGKDGSVSIMVVADSKDTLELLQRDAKDLLRALADAGLKADSSDLNFNLRGQQNQTANNNGNNTNSNNGGSGDGSGNGGSNGAEAGLAAHEIGDIITEDHVDVRA